VAPVVLPSGMLSSGHPYSEGNLFQRSFDPSASLGPFPTASSASFGYSSRSQRSRSRVEQVQLIWGRRFPRADRNLYVLQRQVSSVSVSTLSLPGDRFWLKPAFSFLCMSYSLAPGGHFRIFRILSRDRPMPGFRYRHTSLCTVPEGGCRSFLPCFFSRSIYLPLQSSAYGASFPFGESALMCVL
jgi:hypothetical protein